MSEHKGIGWMYDGVKADAHREDYLLGKTIDKNFEKYSDAVIAQKEDAVDALTKTRVVGATHPITSKISSLPLNVMKSEDPLVAIKVKEESKRRDVLENPLTKMRFQKQIKEMIEKKLRKATKKEKKRKRNRSPSNDDSSSGERKKKKKEKKHKKERNASDEDRGRKEKKSSRQDSSDEDEYKRKDRRDEKRSIKLRHEESSRTLDRREKSRDRSEERRRSRDTSEEEIRKRKRRDSSGDGRRKRRDSSDDGRRKRRDSSEDERRKRRDSSNDGRRNRRDSGEDGRRMRIDSDRGDSSRKGRDSSEYEGRGKREDRRRSKDSSGDEGRSEKTRTHDKKRDFDSHIPAHLRPGSSSESEKEDYDKEEKASKAKWEGYGLVGGKKKTNSDEKKDVKNPYELKKLPKFTVHEKKEKKRPMTYEEKAAKLKEMESNAKWRDDLRISNAKRTRLEDEKEEKDDDGRPASFVKPLLNSVADELSMEDRLKSRKKQLQRGHGYMDKL